MKKLLALLFFCPQLSAYEVETHGLMTQQGFDYSIVGLANPTSVEVYKRLGFDRVDPAYPFLQNGLAQCLVSGEDPKQDAYIDPRPAWLASMSPDIGNRKFRCAQEYEKAAFTHSIAA